jgi:hypothetical protein
MANLLEHDGSERGIRMVADAYEKGLADGKRLALESSSRRRSYRRIVNLEIILDVPDGVECEPWRHIMNIWSVPNRLLLHREVKRGGAGRLELSRIMDALLQNPD